MNERITENFVCDTLRNLGYYDDPRILVEEQRSRIEAVKKLLKGAGKKGRGGAGASDFIISTTEVPDFIILFECKADHEKHESVNGNQSADFAVDGALHYAEKLSSSFNVVAVAVSGQNQSELKVSNFIVPKHSTAPKSLVNKAGENLRSMVPLITWNTELLTPTWPGIAKTT